MIESRTCALSFLESNKLISMLKHYFLYRKKILYDIICTRINKTHNLGI